MLLIGFASAMFMFVIAIGVSGNYFFAGIMAVIAAVVVPLVVSFLGKDRE